MTAGEGIFYGLVFLGFIYLYIQTRDRWNWKKIALWFVGGLATFIALLYAYIFIDGFLSKGKFIPDKPQVVSNLIGVTLGEKVSDAQFRTGAKKKKGENSDYEFPKENWKYFQSSKDGTIERIGIWCVEDAISYPSLYGAEVNGVNCGDKGEKIFEKYGKEKIRISCLKESIGDVDPDTARAYDAIDYGVRYVLLVNSVSGIYVSPPESLKDGAGKKWVDCK